MGAAAGRARLARKAARQFRPEESLMGASRLEYRFRYALHGVIYVLAFWPFWEPWLGLTTKSTWLLLSASMARAGWLSFQGATMLLLVIAIVFTALGAWMRVWGAAYVERDSWGQEVRSHRKLLFGAAFFHPIFRILLVVLASIGSEMQATRLVTDGPYRRTRNPLYLGTLLHTVGLAVLMPPAGAVLAIAAIWILQVRLALAEEPFLEGRFGEAYRAYRKRVPRFLPSPKPLVPAAGQRPQWLQAVLGESYIIGVVITLAAFGWDFNAMPLLKGILISLGISLVLRAFLPRVSEPAVAPGVAG